MKLQRDVLIKLTVYLLALRSPLIILTMIFYLITGKDIITKFIRATLPYLLILLMFILISVIEGNEVVYVLSQSRDIFLCIVVFCFLLVVSQRSLIKSELIYSCLKKTFVVISLVKIAVIIYTAKSGMSVSDVIDWIRDKWNIQMMSLGVQDSIIFRLQIPLDSSVPIFCYFITKRFIIEKEKRLNNGFCLLMLILSMILTLSRAFWAETVFFISLCFLLESPIYSKVKAVIVAVPSFFVIFIFTPLGQVITNILASRLGGSNGANAASDAERTWQNAALIHAFLDNPIIGHGVGYYIPSVIRSDSSKYLYESQTLSMLMDIGILGCFTLLIIILIQTFKSIYHDSIYHDQGAKKIYFVSFCMLLFWCVSGTFNPLLFGVSGGVSLYLAANAARLCNINSEV